MDNEKPRKRKLNDVGEAQLSVPGTPCFLAAAPFFLLSTVLFYYVFTENYNFKWTLVLIFSGCIVVAPGAVLLMLGMKCFSPGWDSKLDNEPSASYRVSDKRKSSSMSIFPNGPPDLQWKAIPIQSDEPLLTKMNNFGYDDEDESTDSIQLKNIPELEEY